MRTSADADVRGGHRPWDNEDGQGRDAPDHDAPENAAAKEKFYSSLAMQLSVRCGISPSDVVVNFVTNADEDWSFGFGRAQFLTGEV